MTTGEPAVVEGVAATSWTNMLHDTQPVLRSTYYGLHMELPECPLGERPETQSSNPRHGGAGQAVFREALPPHYYSRTVYFLQSITNVWVRVSTSQVPSS